MRSPGNLLALVPLVIASSCLMALASEPAELRKLFPREAELYVEKSGLSRLDLPAGVLSACRPDLSDLRLFDAGGREVPFLVDSLRQERVVETVQRFDAPILEAARDEIRRKSGPPLRRETFEIALPPAAPQTGSWALIVETARPEFVCSIEVTGPAGSPGPAGTAGTAKTPLTERGSLFRLSRSRRASTPYMEMVRPDRRTEKTRLPLPPFRKGPLRVTIQSLETFWLEPAFRFESARLSERRERIGVPLEVVTRHQVDGATILELARPRGLVPDRLRLGTATGTFDREVRVWDEGPPGGGAALGSEKLFRLRLDPPVEELEMPLEPARGDRLRVRIDDGDSPPLESVVFTALASQPSLVFALTARRPDETAGTLRFGGGRAHPPRYDIAGFLPPETGTVTGKRASAVARLYDPESIGTARLGPIRDNLDFDRTPALAFAMHPGAEIDARKYSHRRPLEVPGSPEGLVRLRLAPRDLALLRDDLGDLRIVDSGSKQWPYLIDKEAATEMVDLAVEVERRRGHESHYRLRFPVPILRLDRVVLEADAEFFDREYRLTATGGGGGRDEVVEAGRLVRAIGDPRDVTLEIPSARFESIEFVIEDGDDAPLVFRSVRARALLPEVYLAAPEGHYALLLGAPDEGPPRYELARVREVALAVNSAPAVAGELVENPELSLGSRLGSKRGGQQALLWGALGAAVVVLLALTLRLARRESSPPEPP